ncbi:putative Carbonic anhydrase 2 [Hypsibius exemplaris]|uniref:Carbonic anhydrase n=1 Tax=Hypsibius exemplaris TaxID=2072580 RepID=A0A1W0XC49_HYPEX|nr:putative Carbonic anhydrase 2 [Hypsibius exemplaris]
MRIKLPPALWKALYPACSGTRQSPIEIGLVSVVLDLTLESLDLSAYEAHPVGNNWTLVDNGHSVQFSAQFNAPPQIQNGSLGTKYVLTQFHFHWGATDDRGSEHVINGTRYPLELHLVHRKFNETDAQSTADSTGLAVVAVLFEIATGTETANPHLEPLISAVSQATIPNAPVTVTLPDMKLADILPQSPSYYRYLDSLTTPPCAEAVVWTVMKRRVKITETQMQIFRSLRVPPEPTPASDRSLHVEAGPPEVLVDNFRPTQFSVGRVVRYHPEVYLVFVD